MNNLLFSILIPAYKSAYLKECIDSILTQTYKQLEVIVVDDASPEDLKSIVELYDDSRIRFYRNEKNCGAVNVVDNWNKCLELAKGEYVICMGDDDRLLPWCLEEYVNLIDKYPQLYIYHAWTQIIDEDSCVKSVLEPRPEFESFFSLTYHRWTGRSQFIGDFCIRTDHLKSNNGYYFLPLAWGGDDITAARAALFGGISNTKRPCFEYRQSRITISNGTETTKLKLHSSLEEKEWYKGVLSRINKFELSPSDGWFFDNICSNIDVYFERKMLGEIILEIKSNPSRFFMWLRDCTDFGINRGVLLSFVIKELASKII